MTHLVTTLAVRDSRATLRVGDRSNGFAVIKASSVRDGFADEVHARALLMDAGFPVAAPLSYVAGPPSILTLPWVGGRPVDSTCPAASLRRVGELLARVHEIPATGPFAGNATWSGWMAGWLSHAAQWWAEAVPAGSAALIDDPVRRAPGPFSLRG